MGPGFDSIGIALNLYNRFSMEECDCIDISATGGERIPNDETNLVYQCAKRVYDICGKPMPGLRLIEDCSIPQTRGLGSSSACTVAGLLGANALLGGPLHQENIIDMDGQLGKEFLPIEQLRVLSLQLELVLPDDKGKQHQSQNRR